MTTREVFRAKARQLGVCDESIDQILRYLRPAYDLDSEGTKVGWLGGNPELPLGVTWDGSDVLVASIDLAALPTHSLDIGLPRDGRLLLFSESTPGVPVWEDGPADFPRALYVPPGTETVLWDWSTTEYYDDLKEELSIEPRPLYAKATWDVPVYDKDSGAVVWDEDSHTLVDDALAHAISEYRSLAGHLDPLLLTEHGRCMKLGGLAHPEQGPVEEEVIRIIRKRQKNRDKMGHAPHPREYELRFSTDEEEAAAWTPLANAGFSGVFGLGEGSLYWLIPRIDLSLSRFDRAEAVFQC